MRDTVVGSRLVYTVIRQPEIYINQLETLLYEGYSCRLQASGFSHQTAWNKPAHQLDTLLSILYVLFIWWRTVYLMTFCLSDDVLPYLMTFCLPDDVLPYLMTFCLPDEVLFLPDVIPFTWWGTVLPDVILFTWWRTALPDDILFTWWHTALPDDVLFTWWGAFFTWRHYIYLMRCVCVVVAESQVIVRTVSSTSGPFAIFLCRLSGTNIDKNTIYLL